MKFGGERLLHAPPAAVFAALNDAEVLRRAIPGCESLDKTSAAEMRARVKLKIGPVNAAFNGKVALSDINPPHSYIIKGEGEGGAAGGAKGEAKVQLREQENGTLLIYEAEVQVSGKMAQLGARLMDGVAKQLAAKFFDNFAAQINPPNTTEAESATGKQSNDGKKPPKVKMLVAAALIIGALAALFAAVN